MHVFKIVIYAHFVNWRHFSHLKTFFFLIWMTEYKFFELRIRMELEFIIDVNSEIEANIDCPKVLKQ